MLLNDCLWCDGDIGISISATLFFTNHFYFFLKLNFALICMRIPGKSKDQLFYLTLH
jgi:hypothetical protein